MQRLRQAITHRATRLRRAGRLAPDYVQSAADALRAGDIFDSVQRFLLFIGYPRSGHSLIGALLGAHPRMVISNELNVLKYLQAGFGRRQLYSLILRKDRWWAANGCPGGGGYSYAVPGQWQGRFEEIQVIGDKRGGYSSLLLSWDPGIMDRLERMFGERLRVIHIVRNPYDNIATMFKRADEARTFPFVARRYLDEMCEASARTLDFAGPERSITMRHEDFIADPRGRLRELCGFLDQEADDGYLDACAGIVYESSKRTRHSAPWTPEIRAAVEDGIRRYPFLHGYTFDD